MLKTLYHHRAQSNLPTSFVWSFLILTNLNEKKISCTWKHFSLLQLYQMALWMIFPLPTNSEWPISILALIFLSVYRASVATKLRAWLISPAKLDKRRTSWYYSLFQKLLRLLIFYQSGRNHAGISPRVASLEALWLRDAFWCCLNMTCYFILSFLMGIHGLTKKKHHLHHGQ